MSTSPPTEWFPGINFNISFYIAKDQFVTKQYVDDNFLKCVGYAYSRAIATTFSNIIYANGGIETTFIKATGDISANTFTGGGASLTSLNASNISSGTLTVARGGTGLGTLPLNQILIGNNISSIFSTSLLMWDPLTDSLNGKFVGSGAGLSNLNADNFINGILDITFGGTGVNSLIADRLLIGGTTAISQSGNLTWATATNILTATNFSGDGSRLTNINVGNASAGTLSVSRGGTGATTFTAGRLLIGNSTSAITEDPELTWNGTTNILTVSGTGAITTVSATNIGIGITNPTTSSIEIVRPVTTATDIINMRYDANNGLRFQQAYVAANDVKYITIAKNNNVDVNALTYYKGNIGIGTTAPLVETNTTRLHIYNAVSSRLLLDTTITGTAALEFRRGTGTDIQQDFRIINDTDSTLKLQYENNQAAYADSLAQLMWVLPNVTSGLLSVKNWKNTEYVGNVGIGKTFSTTLKLDVLGDAAISGTTTLGTLTNTTGNITTANITTANITDLNATRIDGTTQILIGDADYIGAALFFISTTGTDSSAVKIVYTVNGVYQLAVSSLLPTGSKIELIYDNNPSTFWTTLNNLYTKENALTTGRYLANTTGTVNINHFVTTVTTIGLIYGEWVQIRYPKRVAISNILFTPQSLPRAIIRGYLLGSNNGTTWDAVYTEFTVTAWTTTAERSLLPSGYIPNTKQYLYYRLVARQVQGVTTGAAGAVESLAIATLRFTYNQNVAFIDSVLCIGDPVGGTTPAANCILDVNGATNIEGSVAIRGGVGVGVTDTTTYKLNVSGTLNTSGNITTSANVGIGNTAPTGTLCLGTSQIGGSDGFLLIGKNNGGGGARSQRIGYNANFDLTIGDYGGGTGPWIEAIKFSYAAPANSLVVNGSGHVSIGYDNYVGGNTYLRNTFIYSGNEGSNIALYFATPFTGIATQACKSAIIAQAISSYSRHHMCFCLNTAADNTTNASTNDIYIRLNTGGYVEITRDAYVSGNFYLNTSGSYYGGFYSVPMTNTDYLSIEANTGLYTTTNRWIRVAYGSFTAFHRSYTDDELYNNETDENIDIFKNNFMGRVVIATGKIKTDCKVEQEEEIDPETNMPKNIPPEWCSKIDKDGITIEDAVPIVQLSRKRKDKRVFGVFGEPTRSTNNKNRLIINSIGEGAICVANTNGNIENGDYIQSSDLLGYGEKQDDDLLHNYTIAKSTIDCNFELDSPYYQCHEIENGVRVAFIACSYHCG